MTELPPGNSSASRRRRRAKRSLAGELVFLVLLTLALAALIRTFLAQPFYIPSGSMENTLQVGDRVLVDKIGYRFHDVRRGDVVVFNGLDSFTPEVATDEPRNPLARSARSMAAAFGFAPPDEKDFIKRVIGVPGDHVRCCDRKGRVIVNGRPLNERPYLYPGDDPSEVTFDLTVPEGRLWVMGDHRSNSADSRAHQGDPGGGTVPVDKVIGRAFSVVWPLGRVTGLGTPATFGEVGPRVAAPAPSVPYALALGAVAPVVVRRRRRRVRGRRS